MSRLLDTFRAEETLRTLHGFQRDAVEYAFHRLYTAPDSTRRFLVADEVGLGKTLIAKGVLAKTLEHLRSEVDRIDVVYICSNLRIARQNINRLNPLPDVEFADAERITLLPTKLDRLANSRINFVAFTPGTSLDLKGNLGVQDERILLFALLERHWRVKSVSLLNVLQGGVKDTEAFRARARDFLHEGAISEELEARFRNELDRDPTLRAELDRLCMMFGRARQYTPEDDRRARNAFVGKLRSLLAATCIRALEPDLVILDEFQRFKSLLDSGSDEGHLALELLAWKSEQQQQAARVLLLSATPYKAYTLQHEIAEDDHYQDFIRTVSFLDNDPKKTQHLQVLIDAYRREMFRVNQGGSEVLLQYKQEIESHLRRVMSRTERLVAACESNGMVRVSVSQDVAVQSADLNAYISIRALADALEGDDPIEYWKSAAYPLNFIEGYKLSRVLREQVSGGRCARSLLNAIRQAGTASLPFHRLRRYEELHVPNARHRSLQHSLQVDGAFDVLWLPPALPYYRASGPFAGAKPFTKRLIFSAWHMVPRSIAALLSYESERRAFLGDEVAPRNDAEARKNRRGLLRFSRSDDRLTGLPNFTLMYPCRVLANLCDPRLAVRELGPDCTAEHLLAWAEDRVRTKLSSIAQFGASSEISDEQWYWKAPMLLDLMHESDVCALTWWKHEDLSNEWSGLAEELDDEEDSSSAWRDHVAFAHDAVVSREWPGTKAPYDLPRILALIGLGAPATVALRAFDRLYPEGNAPAESLKRTGAAQIGWAFRTLFNRPESMAIVRRGRDEPYWKLTLEYGYQGCLSSVLDEYVHVLRDSCGVTVSSADKAVPEIAATAMNALQVRSASLEVDELALSADQSRAELRKQHMRSLFAMRFGSDKDEDRKQVQRDSSVRDAFNSPFWPFVLATTSVGQEGLDFHWYCHCVVHWNLPSNPVDLEQREGRVHRFKGHAVRKNIARLYRDEAIHSEAPDVWESAFTSARCRMNGDRGLVPYWIFPIEGGAFVERQIPLYPLSRDEIRYRALRRSLGAYRIVFGQPRQDELLAYLMNAIDPQRLQELSQLLRVNLLPPPSTSEPPAGTEPTRISRR